MIQKSLMIIFGLLCFSGIVNSQSADSIKYKSVKLSAEDRKILEHTLAPLHSRYDPSEKMIRTTIKGWNYHTDAQSGSFHEVRLSFSYASGLLDLGGEKYKKRAFDIIEKTISLQDTISTSRTSGVWPYYLEEPFATKKSSIDFNWADFCSVSLLDVYMGHFSKLPEDLKKRIRTALIYAAKSVQKRDVQPAYTNIAIMGTYVTYMVSNLFDLTDMSKYSAKRLDNFYNYTLERGFTEYNSPTYTIVALDELDRMKSHIAAPADKAKIDSLYALGWGDIARHYHKPSGQWAGPHSRSYNSLVQPAVYGIFKHASDGKIDLPGAVPPLDVKIKHQIPSYLLPYFLTPVYPRTEKGSLTINEPKIIGTTYLTDQYALSTANRSLLWKQRRPFLAYWGTPEKPHYFQVRFLHDFYDFCAAAIYSEQKENSVIAAINFLTNGGDKHTNNDKLVDAKFKAKDLRLRFEIGNSQIPLVLPEKENDLFGFTSEGLSFQIQLFHAAFGQLEGHWEKGGNEKDLWIDYVIYHGEEKEIDLKVLEEATLGFTFNIGNASKEKSVFTIQNGIMVSEWKGLNVTIPVKPTTQPKNL